MQTKILFLDDMKSRHDEFRRVSSHSGLEIINVWSAKEAIDALKANRFDQVFLDHDLSENDIMMEVDSTSNVPTGMDVVHFILEMENPPPEVVVHSCNAPAALRMAHLLGEHKAGIKVKRLAFPWLLHAIEFARDSR